jgi:pimeloyl-[acyl-carrier protein] methyl ester esterase
VSYPCDHRLSFEQIVLLIKSALPADEAFAVFAESFSAPLAVSIAAYAPKNFKAVVICAGFVSPPCGNALATVAKIIAPVLFSVRMPAGICRRFLVGKNAPNELVGSVQAAISRVSPDVLTHRFRSVLTWNRKEELSKVPVPLLYITGLEDKLVRENSYAEIKDLKADTQRVSIKAPHLVVQSNPRESAVAIVGFLGNI